MLICKLFCCTLETVIVWPHVCMEMRGNVMPHGIKESRCFKFSGRHDRSVGPKITSRIEAFLHMVALWWHMAALKWQARRQLWRFCSSNVANQSRNARHKHFGSAENKASSKNETRECLCADLFIIVNSDFRRMHSAYIFQSVTISIFAQNLE